MEHNRKLTQLTNSTFQKKKDRLIFFMLLAELSAMPASKNWSFFKNRIKLSLCTNGRLW